MSNLINLVVKKALGHNVISLCYVIYDYEFSVYETVIYLNRPRELSAYECAHSFETVFSAKKAIRLNHREKVQIDVMRY